MENEIWKKISGFDGIYEVSNLGRIKSHVKGVPKILEGTDDGSGYLKVSLTGDKLYRKKIHQIVAIEFLNHIPCGMKITVDHIDGNKKNNRVDNLQLLSTADNVRKFFTEKTGYNYPRKCSVDGCDNKHDARGYCKIHWRRHKQSANPLPKVFQF